MESHGPHVVEAVIEVAGHLLGRGLIDYLRKNFVTSRQVEQGDDYMDRSRELLQKHLQLMELDEQTRIRDDYMKARIIKRALDNNNGSRTQKLFQARKYKRRAKESFTSIKKASDQVVDDSLVGPIPEATHEHGSGSGDNAGTGPVPSTLTNPFSDSHAISMLTASNISVDHVDQVEMSTFQNEDTGESAVIFDLHGQDSSIQHIVTTFPPEVISGDRADGEVSQSVSSEATVALSVHREDGSTPRLVTMSLQNISPR